MKTVTIYKIICPISRDIKYIGKTTLILSQRLKNHLQMSSSIAMINWMQSLKRKGLQPIIKKIEYVTSEEANKIEKHYIRKYALSGCKLFNVKHNPVCDQIRDQKTNSNRILKNLKINSELFAKAEKKRKKKKIHKTFHELAITLVTNYANANTK